MTQTIKFVTFPFTHKGIKFVSRIAETSRFLPQIVMMGDEFIKMNRDAIDDLLQITDETTNGELRGMIATINAGGTEMFLELDGE
jgi:hypothetical protein